MGNLSACASVPAITKTLQILASGQPLKGPVAWIGPIVMNTEAELRQAFQDYRNSTFTKH
ncbi:pirin-like C-terminal cupin domain-containing protein [Nitrosomonas mobilis]|uniref:pirin-like C-terminal cupin domain-containing protein n=1 Tax=Nitrosomonas mobilis TaxID=51642 RepID=UPI003CCBC7B0